MDRQEVFRCCASPFLPSSIPWYLQIYQYLLCEAGWATKPFPQSKNGESHKPHRPQNNEKYPTIWLGVVCHRSFLQFIYLINIMFFEFLQLSLEAHVWIGTGSRRTDNRQCIFPAKVCDGHDVGNHQCDTPGDTGKAAWKRRCNTLKHCCTSAVTAKSITSQHHSTAVLLAVRKKYYSIWVKWFGCCFSSAAEKNLHDQ